MAENIEINNNNSSDCKSKTVKILLSKNLNKATSYLTPNAKQAFI